PRARPRAARAVARHRRGQARDAGAPPRGGSRHPRGAHPERRGRGLRRRRRRARPLTRATSRRNRPREIRMELEFLMVPGAPPPPPTAAYSHAVRAGDLLFVTGQLGVDPATGALVPGGVVAQTRQVMTNLKTVLAGAGTSLDRAVMARVYLVNFG